MRAAFGVMQMRHSFSQFRQFMNLKLRNWGQIRRFLLTEILKAEKRLHTFLILTAIWQISTGLLSAPVDPSHRNRKAI